MINWLIELTLQQWGILFAMVTGATGAVLGVVNSVKAASDRQWNRSSEKREEQRDVRKAVKQNLEDLEIAMRSFPELAMGLHGHQDIPEPPADSAKIALRLTNAIGKTGDDGLNASLAEMAPIVTEFLETWEETHRKQAQHRANPARSSGSSDAQMTNLREMVQGKVKLKKSIKETRESLRLIGVAHDSRLLGS